MGDKKRKLAEDTPADEVAPEGKKMKKEKKDKKEKKEKKEKRKAEKEVEATPAVIDTPAPSAEEKQEKEEDKKTHLNSKEQPKEKRERKKVEKKEKREQKEKRSAEKANLDDEARAAKKAAKRAKSDKKKLAQDEATSQEKAVENGEKSKGDKADTGVETEASNETGEADQDAAPQKNARFICFVGNLPYSANLESLTKHFEKNPPAEIRVATKKEAPTKCRGFAFIEFDNYDRMKTCLKLYHHSMFDDGKYPPRRINVELTAGGGGSNSEHRKAKIQAKNEKLNEERQRYAKDIKKDKKKYDKKKPAHFGAAVSGANAVAVNGAGDGGDDQFAGMHPSRRGRI